MPRLVQGHLLFTDEDYFYADFYEKIKNDVNEKSITQLLDEYNNSNLKNNNNIGKKDLENTFIAFARLAYANGYTINDLMKCN